MYCCAVLNKILTDVDDASYSLSVISELLMHCVTRLVQVVLKKRPLNGYFFVFMQITISL